MRAYWLLSLRRLQEVQKDQRVAVALKIRCMAMVVQRLPKVLVRIAEADGQEEMSGAIQSARESARKDRRDQGWRPSSAPAAYLGAAILQRGNIAIAKVIARGVRPQQPRPAAGRLAEGWEIPSATSRRGPWRQPKLQLRNSWRSKRLNEPAKQEFLEDRAR